MSEMKIVQISGEAAKSIGGKKKATRKKKQEGGASYAETAAPYESYASPPIIKIDTPVQPVAPVQPVHPVAPVAPVQPVPRPVAVQQGGDTRQIKVELKKKHHTKKVQLHPKMQKVAKDKKTKKNRKILLGISTLHKRMTRAKKMQKKVKEMSLQELKEELIKKKLIKATSKAPESVLRQIASDSQIVEGKAL